MLCQQYAFNYQKMEKKENKGKMYDFLDNKHKESKHKEITLAIINRPPKQNAAEDYLLHEEIPTIINNKDAIIMSDFNCPSINWNLATEDQEGGSNRLNRKRIFFFK